MLQYVPADREPTYSNTTSVQVNWGPAEAVDIHDKGRPRVIFRTASLRLRTMEKGLGESLLWSCAGAWCASVRDAFNAIGDAGSTRPG